MRGEAGGFRSYLILASFIRIALISEEWWLIRRDSRKFQSITQDTSSVPRDDSLSLSSRVRVLSLKCCFGSRWKWKTGVFSPFTLEYRDATWKNLNRIHTTSFEQREESDSGIQRLDMHVKWKQTCIYILHINGRSKCRWNDPSVSAELHSYPTITDEFFLLVSENISAIFLRWYF